MQRYESTPPQAYKSTYTPNDLVDFEITFLNKKLVGNSIRLEGDLNISQTNGTALTNEDIKFDNMVGAHSLISQITTTTQNQGVIENFDNYGRYIRMVADGTMDKDRMINSDMVCELRSSDQSITKEMLRKVTESNLPVADQESYDNDFSIKPRFCLNNVIPATVNDNIFISYRETGAIKLSITLATVAEALYGNSLSSNYTYSLSNLRLRFMTIPDDGTISKKILRTKVGLAQTINSNFANISTKVPAVVRSVSASFLPLSDLNDMTKNHLNTSVVPLVDEVTFIYNDSQNRYIAFPLRDRIEMIKYYIESLNSGGETLANTTTLKSNTAYGLGVNLGTLVDFTNTKFNLQLKSAVTSANSYMIYLFFHGELEM